MTLSDNGIECNTLAHVRHTDNYASKYYQLQSAEGFGNRIVYLGLVNNST